MAQTPEHRELPPPLASSKGDVLTFYHYGQTAIATFAPFSHFGTMQAAFDRMINKDVLAKGAAPETYLNGTAFYPVHLRLKNPLIVHDDFTWGDNGVTVSVMNQLSGAERNYIQDAHHEKLLDADVCAELERGDLYDIGDDWEQNRSNLARQRVIAILESKGYDSIAYVNQEEDRGAISWVNFRPQQVESSYAGPMIDKPCLELPVRPVAWHERLSILFNKSGKEVSESGLDKLTQTRWVSPPEHVQDILAHFADVQEDWDAEQELRERQFRAEIEIAAYDPEYIAARAASGDDMIADFHVRCRQKMQDLAAKKQEDLPLWQRSYWPDIQRTAAMTATSAVALNAKPAAMPRILPPTP